MAVHVTYSYSLARIMRRAGVSTRGLAACAGVDRAGLRRIRKGLSAPSWAVACRIADALGVDLGEFVGRKRRRRNIGIDPSGSIKSKEVGDGEA